MTVIQASAQGQAGASGQPASPQKLLLSLDEALPLMGGISLRTFQREVKRGRIRVLHVGRRVTVPYGSLVAYVRRLCDEQGVSYDEMALAG